MVQTWDNYGRNYYYKNRKKILARKKEKQTETNRKYYETHKEELKIRRKAKREAKRNDMQGVDVKLE